MDYSKIKHGDKITIIKIHADSRASLRVSGTAVMRSKLPDSWIIKDRSGKPWIASPKNIVGVKHYP